MTHALDGITVLDFGRYIAGPFCGALLADLGADVIRIEKLSGSEDRYMVPVTEGGEGAMFLQMNRNKRSMTLNPMKPEGREIVHKLAATADVVIANLPPQTIAAMGLDYASLQSVKPDIILTTVSAYGEGGPYSERVGFDGIGQAMSGGIYMSGRPDEPIRAQVPFVDFGTALLATVGTLTALLHRRETGQGQHVESSLLGTALMISNTWLIEQSTTARDRVPTGNRGQTTGPNDLFRTRDGWIILQVVGNPLFERWAELMGEDHWLTDPRFASDEARGDNGEALSERTARWCAERTTEQALGELQNARIPGGPVLSPQQALDDAHIQAMNFFSAVDYPGLTGSAPISDTPVRLSATPGGIRRRPPTLGEHTDEIMAALGYDSAEIGSFKQKRVI